MTQPTQAQIRAVAEVVAEAIRSEADALERIVEKTINAVLAHYVKPETEMRVIHNAVVERCALAAETWKQGGSTESSGIAAAIRKLKDAP